MKIALPLILFSTLSVTTAESIYFEAKGESIQGPLVSYHEGAGFHYFLVENGEFGEIFDYENGEATNKEGEFTAYVGTLGPYFAVGPAITPTKFQDTDHVINNLNFWACKNTGDPYSYSVNNYIIAVNAIDNSTAPFTECTPVDIQIMENSARRS